MANPLLFQPFTLRGLEIRNRLWAAPMCQYSAIGETGPEQGVPGDWHVQHLGGLARGGAGLVVVEATSVVPEGRITPGCLGLYTDEQEEAFARILPSVKMHGARVALQLAHAGRKASTARWFPGKQPGTLSVKDGGWEIVAPSAIALEEHDTPRALTLDEIADLIDAYSATTYRALRAGFEAVEIHAAHGYLLHEFLSPLCNVRDDAYGGSAENRARIVREIAQRLRAEHPDLPIIVRLSTTEWVEGGFEPEDAGQLAEWLLEDGVDLIDCSTGGNQAGSPIFQGPAYQVPFGSKVREAGMPSGAVGLITTAEQAETLLATGQADIISLGRPLLTNPHLPITWAHQLRAEGAADLIPSQYARARF